MSKCKYCGEEFKPKQGVEKFCSRECWGKSRRVKDVKVDYVGFNNPDEFVVGYGLDYAQRYRNLPFIGVVEGVE